MGGTGQTEAIAPSQQRLNLTAAATTSQPAPKRTPRKKPRIYHGGPEILEYPKPREFPLAPEENDSPPSNILFLGGVKPAFTADFISSLLPGHAPTRIVLPIGDNGRPTLHAFLHYPSAESAWEALNLYTGQTARIQLPSGERINYRLRLRFARQTTTGSVPIPERFNSFFSSAMSSSDMSSVPVVYTPPISLTPLLGAQFDHNAFFEPYGSQPDLDTGSECFQPATLGMRRTVSYNDVSSRSRSVNMPFYL